MSQEQQDSHDANEARPPGRSGLVALRWVLALDIFLVTACIGLQLTAQLWNRQTANIIIFCAASIAVIATTIWFAVASRFGLMVRLLPSLALLLILAAGAVCLDGTDGNLIPNFRWPWLADPDEALVDKLMSSSDKLMSSSDVDPSIQSVSESDPASFPQFLGPNRDASARGIDLARDWVAHPPELLWRQEIGAGYSGFSTSGDYAFTMEQRGEQELTVCYHLKTGQMAWWHAVEGRYEHGLGGVGPRGTPTIHQGRVYASGATGVLRCLNISNGDEIWSRNLPNEFGVPPGTDGSAQPWGRTASPLVLDGLVIVPAGGKQGGPCVSLVAYDSDSGDEVWRGGDSQISCASPNVAMLCGQRQIIIVNETNVTGHRLDGGNSDGEVLWKFDWYGAQQTSPSCSQAVALAADRIFVSKHYGGGSALFQLARGDDGEFLPPREIWRDKRTMKTKFTNVAVLDGYAYGLSDGILECVTLESGERQWKKRQEYGHGQLLRVNDLLLIQCENGDIALVAADPTGHRELARLPKAIDGQTWNNPCLHGRYLLVRNSKEAACYRLPTGDLSEPAPLVHTAEPNWFVIIASLVLVALVGAVVGVQMRISARSAGT